MDRRTSLGPVLVLALGIAGVGCGLLLGDGQYYVADDAAGASGDASLDATSPDAGASPGDASSDAVPPTADGPCGACATHVCNSMGCSGATTAGRSCSEGGAGIDNCPGLHATSCCTSDEVPPPGDASPPPDVSGFRLDTYLVTVGRFRPFVAAWRGGWTPKAGSGKHAHLNGGKGLADADKPGTYEPGWQTSGNSEVVVTDASLDCSGFATWTPSPGSRDNLPINCLNWYEAYAFCIWDDGFLPSEAEYFYAAEAGSQQRLYPWGNADPKTANQYAIFSSPDSGACYYPDGGPCIDWRNIAPVGKALSGVAFWGQYDLAGNIQGWDLDWYNNAGVATCTDCAHLSDSSTGRRVIRGGAFQFPAFDLVTSERYGSDPAGVGQPFGVRCARVP